MSSLSGDQRATLDMRTAVVNNDYSSDPAPVSQQQTTSEDKFRLKEKAIKAYMKELNVSNSEKKKQQKQKKRKKEDETNTSSSTDSITFDWSEVIDIRGITGAFRSTAVNASDATSDNVATIESKLRTVGVERCTGYTSSSSSSSSSKSSSKSNSNSIGGDDSDVASISATAEIYRLLVDGSSNSTDDSNSSSTDSGFYIVLGALSPALQLHWAHQAVAVYSRAAHTNLTNLAKICEHERQGQEQGQGQHASETDVLKRADRGEGEDIYNSSDSSSTHNSSSSANNSKSSLWESCCALNINGDDDYQRYQQQFSPFKALRWACVGYHYNWTRRAYVQEERSPFPPDLAALCSNTAACVAAASASTSSSSSSLELEPEAGIINYYPLGSCMGGHLDDAEHNLSRPIVSFSIGLSGLFLLGGPTKATEPRVLYLRSGDAVVMSGASRLCYHGVPVIIPLEQEQLLTPGVPSTFPSLDNLLLQQPGGDNGSGSGSGSDSEAEQQQQKQQKQRLRNWSHVLNYLRGARVNLNARQVRCHDGTAWVDKTGTGYV